MTREVTDQLYIELGYFTPEEFYVYMAEAVATPSMSTSIACDAGKVIEFQSFITATVSQSTTVEKIKNVSADWSFYIDNGYYDPVNYYEITGTWATIVCELTEVLAIEGAADLASEFAVTALVGVVKSADSQMSAAFTQTATISHIHGADLFAFSEALLAAQVDLIRDNNIAASSVFDVATDFVRTRTSDSDVDSIFSAIIAGLRSRDVSLETQAAFSFVSSAEVTKDFNSTITSTAEVAALAEVIKDNSSGLSAEFQQTVLEDRIRDNSSSQSAEFAVDSTVSAIREVDSSQTATTDIYCLAINLQGFDIIVYDFATVAVDAVKITDSQSTQASEFQQTAAAGTVKSADSNQFSEFANAIVAEKITDVVSTQSSEFAQATLEDRIRGFDSAQNSDTSVYCLAQNLQGFDIIVYNFAAMSVDAVKITNITRNLAGQFTQSTLANYSVRSSSAIRSHASVFVSRRAYRPKNLQVLPSSNFDSSIKKFGSHSLKTFNESISTDVYVNLVTSNDWLFEGFILVPDQPNITFENQLIRINGVELSIGRSPSYSGFRARLRIINDSGVSTNYTTASLSSNLHVWHHIAVVKTGTTLSAYYDGVRFANITAPTSLFRQELVIGGTGTNYTDDVHLAIGNTRGYSASDTNISVPTSEISNIPLYTEFLYHFNNNTFDDNSNDGALQTASATASAQFAIPRAYLSGPQKAAAAFTATSNLTAVIGKLNEINLVAFSDALLTVEFEKFKSGEGQFTSEFQVTADISVTKQGQSAQTANAEITATADIVKVAESQQTSEFTQTVDGIRVRYADSSQSSEFTQTTDSEKITDAVAGLESTASLDATALRIFDFQIVTESIATQLTVVARVADFFINCDVIATQTTDAVKTATVDSQQSSEFTQNADIEKITGYAADLNVNSLVSIPGEALRPSDSQLASDTALTALATKAVLADSTLISEFTTNIIPSEFIGTTIPMDVMASVFALADRFAEFDSNQNSQFAQTADAVKTTDIQQSLDTNTALTCTISHILGADIVAENFASLNCDFDRISESAITLSAETAITLAVEKFTDYTAALSSQAGFTAEAEKLQGQTINLNSDSAVSAATDRIRDFSIVQSADAALTCIISHIEGADIVAENFASLSADAEITVAFEGNFTVDSTLVAEPSIFREFAITSEITANLAADSQRLRGVNSDFTAISSSSIEAEKIAEISADLVVAGFILAEGRDLRIDRILYRIPGETRVHKIASESRVWKIRSETRIHTIRRL